MNTPLGSRADAALDRFFDTLFTTRPVDATFIGLHEHDHRWPDWTPAGHESALDAWHAARDVLASHASASTHALAADDWPQIDVDLAVSHCDTHLAELASTHYTRGNPSLAIGEAAFGLIGLTTRDFLPAPQRASWLIQRLRQLPAFLAGALATLRETRIPRAWTERALEEGRATARFLEEGVPLWCRAMHFPPDRGRAVDAAAQSALGGVQAFINELPQLPPSDSDAAPCGDELLALVVRHGHWIDRSLDDLRCEALDLYSEARGRLDEMVRASGARDLAEVQERLASRHPSVSGYFRAFSEVWETCRVLSAEHRLVTWPDTPVRYVPIPEWTRMAAPSLYYLYYRSPAPLELPTIHDYVVPPLEGLEDAAIEKHLRTWNDATIKLNHVVHHGALGHHVQNWHAARSPSRIGRVAAADCASRIAMIQGGTMAEGWACYATDLVEEAGFLTAEESVAEQHTRVRMLARAINDLEFHRGHRSFADSVRLYADEVGMSASAARAEAVKNSMFPGTAMMYWLGTSAIHELRREMRRRMGSAFDLQAFHDAFLSPGSIPVALNARLMLQGHADAARRQ